MEFNVKLQKLRTQKGLTQDELAKMLFVSRTAISKWDSGRGYPNIESLKNISKIFSVSLDELLSNDELLFIAEEDGKRKETGLKDLFFGILDISTVLLFFLPLFADRLEDVVIAVSLLSLNEVSLYLKILYISAVALMFVFGIVLLSLQNNRSSYWRRSKYYISLLLNIIVVLLFVISLQPYASAFLFLFLIIKVFLLVKSQRYE